MIYYNDSNHTYSDETGKEYISVTQLVKKFKEPFNENIVYACAKKQNREPDDLKLEWKQKGKIALLKGNYIHDTLDILFRRPELAQNCDLKPVYDEIRAYIPKSQKLYPEKIIGDEELGVVGRVDLIGKEDKIIFVYDYKTNDLDKKVYNNLKPPLQHLEDKPINEYALQLSLYAYMLERQGYKVGGLKLFDIQQGAVEVIELPYLKEEIKKMLEYKDKQLPSDIIIKL